MFLLNGRKVYYRTTAEQVLNQYFLMPQLSVELSNSLNIRHHGRIYRSETVDEFWKAVSYEKVRKFRMCITSSASDKLCKCYSNFNIFRFISVEKQLIYALRKWKNKAAHHIKNIH